MYKKTLTDKNILKKIGTDLGFEKLPDGKI